MFTMDPEVGAALAAMMGPNPPPKAAVGDIETRRAALIGMFALAEANIPPVTDVETKDFFAKASDGHSILCRWFTKKTPSKPPRSAVVYLHGGGMIALTLSSYAPAIARYVSHTSVPFLAIDYRLAPEVTAPVPVTDAFAGLQYLHSHASELGIDPSRIAIMGDSAGGGIAASLAHYSKQQQGPAIAKQILIYPMLDDRNLTADPHLTPFASWTNEDNITGWTALLTQTRVGGPDVSVIEAAGRMSSPEQAEGLPPTYMDVGELDIFRHECLEYVKTLGKGGVSCEFHLVPGANHAFEVFAPGSKVAREVIALRERAVLSV